MLRLALWVQPTRKRRMLKLEHVQLGCQLITLARLLRIPWSNNLSNLKVWFEVPQKSCSIPWQLFEGHGFTVNVEPCHHTSMTWFTTSKCNSSKQPPSYQVCSLGLGNNQHCGANLGGVGVGDQRTPQKFVASSSESGTWSTKKTRKSTTGFFVYKKTTV